MSVARARPPALASSVAMLALLAACATPADLPAPHALADAQALGARTGTAETAEALPDFNDADLAALMQRAVAEHPSVQSAQARVARAQAITGLASSALYGQINGSIDATRQRYSENGLVPPPVAGHVYGSGTAQLGGSWELDLWGRRSAELRSALGVERAAQAEAAVAGQALATQVSLAYVQLARLLAQKQIAQQALAQRQHTLNLIRERVKAGLDTQVELRQGEGALPETRAQIEVLDGQMAQARHALAALTRQPMDALTDLQPALDRLASTAVQRSTGGADIPVDLLGLRPDLQAARQRVEAALQEGRAARAQFYPNVSLSAFAGFSALGLDRLFDAGSRQYGIGPAIHLPIFDGGRLRAQQRVKAADFDAAIEAYNATLLDALRDAADQISLRAALARQATEQASALASAEAAFRISRQRFAAGLGPYLVVLSAEGQVLAQRRQVAELQAQQLANRIQLARALGAVPAASAQPARALASANESLAEQQARH